MSNTDAYVSKMIKFLCFVRQTREDLKLEDNMIIACDETAIWYDAISKPAVEEKGCKEVSVLSTGHVKNSLTVLLSAKGDGTKLKPYILLPKKRPVPQLVRKYGSKAILVFQGTTCMNQALTEDYLNCIIGVPMFTPHRLLVWDSFSCHVSKDTKDSLKKLKVDQVVIPGGCTGYIQVADVCWNKPFKDNYTKSYEDWFEAGKQEFTAAGNPNSAPSEVTVGWIVKVWDSISSDIMWFNKQLGSIRRRTNNHFQR